MSCSRGSVGESIAFCYDASIFSQSVGGSTRQVLEVKQVQ